MNAIATTADAEGALADIASVIAQLSGVIEQESTLVQAGRLRAASGLAAAKSELTGRLFVASERLRTNSKLVRQLAPAQCTALARAQETFRTLLQRNMIVLATAHAVSEGIMRRLSGDLARKASPQVYGATGRTTTPNPKHGRPLAISRSL